MDRIIYRTVREVIELLLYTVFLALSFYGICWFYLLSPENFETTLPQLTSIQSNTTEYHHFFNQFYTLCLFWSASVVGIGKAVSVIIGIFRNKEKTHLFSMGFTPKIMTPKDIQYIAAHEAGHLLVYAALGQLPPSMKVEVKEMTDGTTNFGYVSAFKSKRVTDSRQFVEWHMLTTLAAREGESMLLQDNTLGSVMDNHQWLNLASVYLKNFFEGIFYIEPTSEFEFNANVEKLNALKDRQIQLLRAFFNLNFPAYKQLTTVLIEKKILYGREIILFFQQADIKFPPGFPFPFGEFEKFSEQWLQDGEYDEINEVIDNSRLEGNK